MRAWVGVLLVLGMGCEPSSGVGPAAGLRPTAMASGSASSSRSAGAATTGSAATSARRAEPIQRGPVRRVAWGEAGKTLAAWTAEDASAMEAPPRPVGVWSTDTGKLLGTLDGLEQATRLGVALVSDTRIVVSERQTVHVFDAFTHKKMVDSYLVYDGISLSPNRKRLLFTNGYGVRALDLAGLRKIAGHDFHSGAAMYSMRIEWAPNSKIAVVDHDYEAPVLVDARARLRATIKMPGSKTPGMSDVAWAPDSRVLHVAQADWGVAKVSAANGAVTKVLRKPTRELGTGTPEIEVSPDGRVVAVSGAGAGVDLWVDGKHQGVAPAAPSFPGHHIAMSPDGAWLALATDTEASVIAVSAPDQRILVARVSQTTNLHVLGWTADGVLIVHAGDAIMGWSSKSKKERFSERFAGLANASLSPGGAFVAVAHAELTVLHTHDRKRVALAPLPK